MPNWRLCLFKYTNNNGIYNDLCKYLLNHTKQPVFRSLCLKHVASALIWRSEKNSKNIELDPIKAKSKIKIDKIAQSCNLD